VDCFRLRNKVGLDVALEALKEGWREKKFTADDQDELLTVLKSIASVAIKEPDEVVFVINSFKSVLIKEGEHYQGVRITGQAKLDTARVSIQIDIGFGDAVTPAADKANLPSLLNMPEPHLRVYPNAGKLSHYWLL